MPAPETAPVYPFQIVPPPAHYLHLPDVRMHYHELGADCAGGAPNLVMLHGLGSSSADWFLVAPAFAAHFRLWLIDLRGHGQSSLPRQGGYAITRMADDVRQVLDAAAVPRAHLLGLSLGGLVALQFASAWPDRVDHLTLVNTFARLHSRGSRRLGNHVRRLLAAATSMDALAAYVARSLFAEPAAQALAFERLRHNDLGAIRRTMLAIARFDLRPQLQHIMAPALVLISDGDRTVPRVCADELMAGLPNAKQVLITGAGHALPFDQPDAFTRAVLDFLANGHA